MSDLDLDKLQQLWDDCLRLVSDKTPQSREYYVAQARAMTAAFEALPDLIQRLREAENKVVIEFHLRGYAEQSLREAEATIERLNVEGKASVRKLMAMMEDIQTVQDARIIQLEAENQRLLNNLHGEQAESRHRIAELGKDLGERGEMLSNQEQLIRRLERVREAAQELLEQFDEPGSTIDDADLRGALAAVEKK